MLSSLDTDLNPNSQPFAPLKSIAYVPQSPRLHHTRTPSLPSDPQPRTPSLEAELDQIIRLHGTGDTTTSWKPFPDSLETILRKQQYSPPTVGVPMPVQPQSAPPQTMTFQPFSSPQPPRMPYLPAPQDLMIPDRAKVKKSLQDLNMLIEPLLEENDETARLRIELQSWKQDHHRLKAAKDHLERSLVPYFSVILINGNDLVFDSSLLAQGHEGGSTAGEKLLAAVSSSCAELSSTLVLVMVFVDKSNLGASLLKAGCVPSFDAYKSFWEGFSNCDGLFTGTSEPVGGMTGLILISVLDTGTEKSASSIRLREHLNLYLANRQCGAVIVGDCTPLIGESIAASGSFLPPSIVLVLTRSPFSPHRNLYFIKAGPSSSSSPMQSMIINVPDLFQKRPGTPKTFSEVAVLSSPLPPPSKTASATSAEAKVSPKQARKPRTKEKDSLIRALDPRPCHLAGADYLIREGPRGCRADTCEYSHEYGKTCDLECLRVPADTQSRPHCTPDRRAKDLGKRHHLSLGKRERVSAV
ncbi:hypothetical protein P7C73_g692, partial [Tremellales sp. Uapishka_1]